VRLVADHQEPAMRIAVLGLSHESNTFSPVPGSLDVFEQSGILEGEEILAEYASSEATIGGYLSLSEQAPDAEVVPLLFTRITPMGPITPEAFETLCGRMLTLLAEEGPWDGVLLALHGAAVAVEHPDADGEIARRVRELVGDDVVIGVSHDMHANVSHDLVATVDVLTIYHTNPHVDARERGLEAALLVARTIRGEIHPTMALETPPVAINILRQGTDDEPMRSLMAHAFEQAARDGVLSVSVAEGFPYADVPEMGMAFLAMTDGDEALAREIALDVASTAWEMREEFDATGWDIDDALRHADAADAGPVVLLDVGDNVGGGSPGDSTHLLEAAQRLGIPGVFMSLMDAEAVQACMRAGVGARLELDIGGKTDDLHGRPVRVHATVHLLADGKFEDPTPTHGGFRFYDAGPTARIHTDDGHDLVLTTYPMGTTSRQQLLSNGLDPMQQRIIVAKGVNSPRAAFEPIATEMLFVNTPGTTSADLSTFTYQRRRRPMFPWERDAAYQPSAR
jgi:microcystin degradation protein MlrC